MNEDHGKTIRFCFHASISEIAGPEWNALAGTADPFMRYEFLAALEHHQCLGEKFGWFPYHLSARDGNNTLLAVCPLYIKTNSYGEFVFDWAWASAYQQAGLAYYPKMVSSVPYNPVTGARLVCKQAAIKPLMIKQIISMADKLNMSGMHWLFTDETDTQICQQNQLQLRLGCQYHWQNHDYADFESFLSTFISRKRKKVKRERRMVTEQGISIDIIHGNEASEYQIELAQQFYQSTFDKKSGLPTLNTDFFKALCASMGEQLVFIFARLRQDYIACAIALRGADTLYGRFWGCRQDCHSLHFETCFYQGINYCIEHKLSRFEPGAQGEHKITRGFLPVKTWSAHWIKNAHFQSPIYTFCQQEQQAMLVQCKELLSLSPYRSAP